LFIGYDDIAASDASEDAGTENDGGVTDDASDIRSNDASDARPNDASDVRPNDASDVRSNDAAFDAASDGSALDASDDPRDAAEEGGALDAEIDGSAEGGTDGSTDSGAPPCTGSACTPRCDLTGTFALKLTVPSTWASNGQLSGGSGNFVFRMRLRATQVGNAVSIQLRECGEVVPAFHATLVNEDCLFTYPNSLFDTEVLPSASATMTLGDSTPSSPLSLPPVAMEMGVNLADPLNDPWPATPAGLSTSVRVDAEGDGNPAVTAVYLNTGGYVYPRTSATLGAQRAQQTYIAVRRIFSMTGMLTSCDGSQGSVTLSKLDSRILGCRHADGSLCSASESNHLDMYQPKYQFSAATYVMSRVTDNASCSAVRAVP